MKAMIFAAGLGTRLKPFTNFKPKALAEINGVTLLEITIKRLKTFGFDDIIVNVHHYSNQVIDFLKQNNNFGVSITISDETDRLLDTGGGLKKAAHFFNDTKPFLVHNVDIVSNIDLEALYTVHCNSKNCLATLAAKERQSSREFLINAENELCGWRNNNTKELKISKGTESFLKPTSFCGIHVISPEMLPLITETGVFSIVNTYLRLASEHTIKLMPFNDAIWMDLGTPESLHKAECIFKKG
jgi:NDP-sugar pyrophosphorylase family protein